MPKLRAVYAIFSDGRRIDGIYYDSIDRWVVETIAPLDPPGTGDYTATLYAVDMAGNTTVVSPDDPVYGDQLVFEVVSRPREDVEIDETQQSFEAMILDPDFEAIGILDAYESFIWTDRYCGYGDFEIYMPVATSALQYLVPGNYLWTRESDRLMIIEDLSIDTDAEDGDHITVTGRSLESILDRRIVWRYTLINGNLQNGIKRLLNENVISPTNEKRKIPNFIFRETEDERITSITTQIQLHGESLYDVIYTLCSENGLGFKVTYDFDEKSFIFELFVGEDRSYDQEKLQWVVFSAKYENLLASNYFESLRAFKTVSLVGGEGDGYSRTTVETYISEPGEGLERREMFTDARYVSARTEDGGDMAYTDYTSLLKQSGLEDLIDVSTTRSFEGEIDAHRQYTYGVDFGLGDIVQVVNQYGLEAKSIVSEVVQCQDSSGRSMTPTFTAVNTIL